MKKPPLPPLCALLAALLIGVALTGCGAVRSMFGVDDFATVIQRAQKKVYPALVFIKPIKQQVGSGEKVRTRIFGSGVIISPEGYVITNSHVARSATDIKCVLYDKRQVSAKVVGFDDVIDLALIRLDLPTGHAPLPVAEFADSDKVRQGEFVMALGSPLGFSRSISFGIVSSARRYLSRGFYHLWLQTDAAINPGNSGGPLVDASGKVVGINTLKASQGDNIGFAIPSNTVKDIAGQLREKGRVTRSYIGLHFQPVRDFVRDSVLDHTNGVVVSSVDVGSPASAAGMKAGDLILQLNDDEVNGIYLEDLPAIRCRFAYLEAGKPADLIVQRGDDIHVVPVTPLAKPKESKEGVVLDTWNCSVQAISKFRTPGIAYFKPSGVYVLGVKRPGNAYNSGLRPQDVLLSIDGKPVASLATLFKTYRRLTRLDRGKRTAVIEVQRKGYDHTIVLDFNRSYKR